MKYLPFSNEPSIEYISNLNADKCDIRSVILLEFLIVIIPTVSFIFSLSNAGKL